MAGRAGTGRLKAKETGAVRAARTPLRAGSVPYLNVAPIVVGLEGRLRLLPPSVLARALRGGEIDAGLLSITEALFHEEYDVLEGPCVASFGEVYSVFLAYRRPWAEMRRVYCDTASLTSVNLLRVLLGERGIHPEFVPLEARAEAGEKDFVLLIGDPAIEFRRSPREHRIFDLGAGWREMTGLPFVFAAWVLRRGAETGELRRELLLAAERGRRDLEGVIRAGTDFDEAFRRRYLTEYVRSEMGEGEKAGVGRFVELLRRHAGRPVYEPRYVGGPGR